MSAFGKQVTHTKREPEPQPAPQKQPEAAIVPAAPAAPAPAVPARQGLLHRDKKIDLPEPKPLSGYVTAPLTSKQKAALDLAWNKLRKGAAARGPMVCQASQCVFLQHCDLAKAKVPLPKGEDCPIDLSILEAWRRDFLQFANVSPDHHNYGLIVNMIDDLVVEVMLQSRVMMNFSSDPDILRDEVIGINPEGDPIVAKRLHPGLDFLLRVNDRKLRKLREMLATPKAEVDARRKTGEDPASKTAELRRRVEEATRQAGKGPEYVKVDLNA